MLAPARTPEAVIARLNAEAVRAVGMPEVRTLLAAEGAEPVGSTPAQFAAHLDSEMQRYAAAIKASGAKVD